MKQKLKTTDIERLENTSIPGGAIIGGITDMIFGPTWCGSGTIARL